MQAGGAIAAGLKAAPNRQTFNFTEVQTREGQPWKAFLKMKK